MKIYRESREKYVGEFERAGWWKRQWIHFRIDREVRRELSRSQPSPDTLW